MAKTKREALGPPTYPPKRGTAPSKPVKATKKAPPPPAGVKGHSADCPCGACPYMRGEKTPMTAILVTFPADMLEALTQVATKRGKPRTEIVRIGVESFLNMLRRKGRLG